MDLKARAYIFVVVFYLAYLYLLNNIVEDIAHLVCHMQLHFWSNKDIGYIDVHEVWLGKLLSRTLDTKT